MLQSLIPHIMPQMLLVSQKTFVQPNRQTRQWKAFVKQANCRQIMSQRLKQLQKDGNQEKR